MRNVTDYILDAKLIRLQFVGKCQFYLKTFMRGPPMSCTVAHLYATRVKERTILNFLPRRSPRRSQTWNADITKDTKWLRNRKKSVVRLSRTSGMTCSFGAVVRLSRTSGMTCSFGAVVRLSRTSGVTCSFGAIVRLSRTSGMICSFCRKKNKNDKRTHKKTSSTIPMH